VQPSISNAAWAATRERKPGFRPAEIRAAVSVRWQAVADLALPGLAHRPLAVVRYPKGTAGLITMAQMSAIEIHRWGATEADPLNLDFILFDLDPGEGVPWPEVIRAAGAGAAVRRVRNLPRQAAQLGPPGFLVSGDRPDAELQWVRPELVAEAQCRGALARGGVPLNRRV
jgi:LigD-like primase-polymerase